MRRSKNETVTSDHPAVGDYGQVVNASGEGTGNMQMAPRDKGRPAGDTPGAGTKRNRSPVEVDGRGSGQALADSVQADLRDAAGTRWPIAGLKAGAMADAVQAAADGQYAGIPGLLEKARTYADGAQIGHHLAASVQNERTLHRLFGDPGQECC